MSNTVFEKRTPDQSTWKGRRRKSEQDKNSFAEFVAEAKHSEHGRDHLKRHHGGHGL